MFCRSCGANNPDHVRFCCECGTPIEADAAPVSEPAPAYASPVDLSYGASYSTSPRPAAPSHRKPAKPGAKLRKMLPIAGIGVVFAIILILIIASLGSPKALAKKAVKRAVNGKVTAYVKLYHKDYLEKNDMLEDEARESFKQDEEDWDKAIEKFEEEEGNLRLSYKLKDIDKIKGEDLRELQTYYSEEYDLNIKAAKCYEIEVNAKWGEEEEEEYDVDVTVVKIGGKWYLFSCGNPIYSLIYDYID